MAQMWIDEQEEFGAGDSAFLISFYNENTGGTRYTLRNQPAYTNVTNEPRLNGWCGSYNNISTHAEGVVKVVRIAKSGRYLVAHLTLKENEDFLNEMGYPELIP